MDIVFGCNLDGFVFPETANGRDGSFNQSVCGPLSFLNVLETILGLRQPPAVKALRAAQYMSLLKKASDGSQFYSESLAVDSWSTAGFLLSVRDELVASGWNGQCIDGFAKLNELARVETIQQISDGFGERVRRLRQKLSELDTVSSKAKLPLKKISLVDDREVLPAIWKQLLKQLEACGIIVEQLTSCAHAAAGTDLRKLQDLIIGSDFSSRIALAGDGTLTIIDSIEEAQAAIFAAAWLSHNSEQTQTVIVRGSDCSALSHACQSLSLPSLGPSSRLHFRAILQVLPLAFKLSTRPLDPNTMIEFINLPGGPIPAFVGNKLLSALSDSPGIGGKAWHSAWKACLNEQIEWTNRDHPNLTQVEREEIAKAKLSKFSVWFEEVEFSSSSQVRLKEAEAICLRVENWATERGANDENRVLYELALAQSKLLRQILHACESEVFPLAQLQKMMESVNSYGSTISTAEAASWSIVDKPGQIWSAAENILWWGFAEHNIAPLRTSIWSDLEIRKLHEHDIFWESPVEKLRRETMSWRSPILNATSQLILVKPHMVAGRRASTHPVWDELKVRIDDASLRKISLDPAKILSSQGARFAGVECNVRPVERIQLPAALRTWRIPNVQIKGRARESFSSIERLLGCSLSWVLQYHGGMWASRSFNIPQKQLLLGKLAHAVVDELYGKKKDWRPDEAQRFAAACINDLIPKMAAGLLLPGSAPQLREAKEAIPASVFQLVTFVNDAGAKVEGTEISVKAPFVNGQLTGIVDLLLSLPDGSPAVIDFKWSLSPYFYRKRIVEGRALQLAIYSWLVNESKSNVTDFSKVARKRQLETESNGLELIGRAATPMPPAGFYMFRHAELFFTQDGIFPSYTFVRKMIRDLPDTFELTLSAYQRALEALNEGEAIATGVIDDSLDVFAAAALVEPPCNFCKLGHFCGMKELK